MNNVINKIENIDIKKIHIAVIIIGIIFLCVPVFHTSLWFDEAYSVGMSNRNFIDIWDIGKNDVHPVFYYWCLHILNLIFGNNILIYRLFSAMCISILGILGFTHVRKDFGEKTGLLFSFFVYFLPVNSVYSGEIRMYTLAALLVSVTAIYAYRIYKENTKCNIKNWIIFAIFSLASAYTHYYALMSIGLINLFLLITYIKEYIKDKKLTKNMKAFLISAVSQVLLYIPWVLALLKQIGQVSNNFWIGIHFPGSFIEFFTFPFTGNLEETHYVSIPIALAYSAMIVAYVIYLYVKGNKSNKEKIKNNNEEVKPAKLAIQVFLGIALAACIMSLIIWRPIIYARYMYCAIGLFIFFIAFLLAKRGNKYVNTAICIISVIIAGYININLAIQNYDSSNNGPIDFMEEDMSKDDLILFGNEGSGFVIAVHYPNNKVYFYDYNNWYVDAAYQAFGNDFATVHDNLDILNNYKGRIWIVNATGNRLLENLQDMYGNDIEVIKQGQFSVEYKKYQYSITLVDKVN